MIPLTAAIKLDFHDFVIINLDRDDTIPNSLHAFSKSHF